MITFSKEARSKDLVAQVSHLPEEVSRVAVNYQNKLADYLHEIAHLEGLEELGSKHALPALYLKYSEKVMALYDESVQFMLGQLRRRGFAVQCTPGCDYCCHQMPTGVSTFELIYQYLGMQRSGVMPRFFRRCLESEELWSEISRSYPSKAHPDDDQPDTREGMLKCYWHVEQPCAFLQYGRCRLYSYRPFACRMHFSLSPSYWCHPSHFQNAYAQSFNLEPGECLFIALRELDKRFQLNLSDVMVCGLLELTVNVMQFAEIRWLN